MSFPNPLVKRGVLWCTLVFKRTIPRRCIWRGLLTLTQQVARPPSDEPFGPSTAVTNLSPQIRGARGGQCEVPAGCGWTTKCSANWSGHGPTLAPLNQRRIPLMTERKRSRGGGPRSRAQGHLLLDDLKVASLLILKERRDERLPLAWPLSWAKLGQVLRSGENPCRGLRSTSRPSRMSGKARLRPVVKLEAATGNSVT